MVRYVRDTQHGFGERPHYEPRELDREFEHLAVGFLNIPLLPPFAREDNDFRGAMCHTSSWIDGLDMAGKSVGIVGTGSSAVQVVTEAEKVASEVKIFQLEPN